MNTPLALGIDYGDVRIGVAATDALGFLAHPLETINRRQTPKPEQRIAELAASQRATVVVVGLPLCMDGTEGTAVQKVRAFLTRLRAALPDTISLETVDERLSTVEAQRRLHDAGRNIRNSRPVIDQAAAAIILQDWLDQHRTPEDLLLPDPGETFHE